MAFPPAPRKSWRFGSWARLLGVFLLFLPFSCGRRVPGDALSSPAAELVARSLPAFRATAGMRWPPPSPSILRIYAALGRGDLNQARALVRQELAAHPDNQEASLAGGTILYLSSAFAAARPLLERVLEHGPSFAGCERVFYLYGMCLIRLGEGSAARAALLAHLEFASEDGDTLAGLGELALQGGEAQRARERFQHALKAYDAIGGDRLPALRAGMARVHAGLGQVQLQEGRLEEAQQAFETSLRLDPSQPQVYYALSRVCLRRDDPAGARRALDRFGQLQSATSALPTQR